MAIAYLGKTFAFNATSGTTTSIPMPAATTAGSRLLAVVGSIGNTPTLTDPAGGTWSKVAEYAPGTTLKSAVFVRDATGGDNAATYTWTWSASGKNFGYALAYSGVDLTAPTLAQSVWTQDDDGPTDSPALALADGDWLVTAVVARENPGTSTAKTWSSDDTSDVKRYDLYTTVTLPTIQLSAALWDSGRPLAAGSADRAVQASVLMQQFHTWSIRLAAPAAAPPPAGNPWTSFGQPIR